MSKQFWLIILIIVLVFQRHGLANAISAFNYGTMIANPVTMEGTITHNVTVHNSGGYNCITTSDEKHSGNKSFMIDCVSSTGQCLVETANLQVVDSGIYKNNVLLEMYVKGFDIQPSSVGFYVLLRDKSGSILSMPSEFSITCESANADGWHRIWGILPPCNYDRIIFGVSYNRSVDDGITALYIDDISARVLPVGIKFENSICRMESISLDKIRVIGYDASGSWQEIHSKDLIRYTVLSGDGIIDENNNIVYTGADGSGNVRLKGDFLGLTSLFTITFQKGIYAGEVICIDGIYRTTVTNATGQDKDVALLICVYDGGRLSDIKVFDKTVPAGSNAEITSTKISVPFYVKNPVIKTFVIEKPRIVSIDDDFSTYSANNSIFGYSNMISSIPGTAQTIAAGDFGSWQLSDVYVGYPGGFFGGAYIDGESQELIVRDQYQRGTTVNLDLQNIRFGSIKTFSFSHYRKNDVRSGMRFLVSSDEKTYYEFAYGKNSDLSDSENTAGIKRYTPYFKKVENDVVSYITAPEGLWLTQANTKSCWNIMVSGNTIHWTVSDGTNTWTGSFTDTGLANMIEMCRYPAACMCLGDGYSAFDDVELKGFEISKTGLFGISGFRRI